MPIRENKFARRAREREREQQNGNTKKLVLRDQQPTVEEQLARLEEDIRRLKVEFDIYFNGAAKRPPYDTKGRVETLIKRLADERTLSFAQRYHYNSLAARFTSFMQLWRRTMQDREEGRGAAAQRRASAPAPEPESSPATFVSADPRSDVRTVRGLYEALVEARQRCGEPTDDLSFARFHRMVAEKSQALKERAGCERVHFSVAVKDGRVQFKAKAEK
ncbi:MAG TPA: MXAN_5187 C-terminal domain-containing protein [Pyrinomonadaceae bacterium]